MSKQGFGQIGLSLKFYINYLLRVPGRNPGWYKLCVKDLIFYF